MESVTSRSIDLSLQLSAGLNSPSKSSSLRDRAPAATRLIAAMLKEVHTLHKSSTPSDTTEMTEIDQPRHITEETPRNTPTVVEW